MYNLTEFSHGAGCGCKLSPGVLSEILGENGSAPFANLLVGNDTKDDAAVVSEDGVTAIVSTADFFMPIVDDAYDFGAIAATNAISDIYAMGARPIMAIAILGWPVEKLPAQEASRVLKGGREVCLNAGIPLAGGHSIDTPEPIFGLAVTGTAQVKHIKRNNGAQTGDLLYLTKRIGVGLVTTAQKRKLADENDLQCARQSMLQLNRCGTWLGELPYVHGLTDVTGFGLAGHLLELCEGSAVAAEISMDQIPAFDFVGKYLSMDCIPGGTNRNWYAFGNKVQLTEDEDFKLLADPQTSGGLLIAVDPGFQDAFEERMRKEGEIVVQFGKLVDRGVSDIVITVK